MSHAVPLLHVAPLLTDEVREVFDLARSISLFLVGTRPVFQLFQRLFPVVHCHL